MAGAASGALTYAGWTSLNPSQPILKRVFRGAADAVINTLPKHPLHVAYQRAIAAGTKPNLARLTLARHLAADRLALAGEARETRLHRRQAVRIRRLEILSGGECSDLGRSKSMLHHERSETNLGQPILPRPLALPAKHLADEKVNHGTKGISTTSQQKS